MRIVHLPPLTPAEWALIVRATAGHALPGTVGHVWTAAAVDTAVDALCDLMLAEGFHGEWQPTALGREIEALIDKLDRLLDQSAAA
ncbi:MAG: hypothetical protein U1E49_00035 [Hyphomicrobiaceae bacterium]